MRADMGSAVPSSHISKVKVLTEDTRKIVPGQFQEESGQQKGKREGKRHTGVLVAPPRASVSICQDPDTK